MTPLWLSANRLCRPSPLGHLPPQPAQAQGNATLSRRVPLDSSPQDTDRRQPPWALRALPITQLHATPGGKGPRTKYREAPDSGPQSAEPSYLVLFSALFQPGPLHPAGGLVLGPSATLHLADLLTSALQSLSVPTYRPASTTAEATSHQPPAT